LAAGRHFVIPADVQRAVGPALGHRLILTPGSERSGTGVEEIVADLVQQVALPNADTAGSGRPVG
jgi:MoxR-like ATPase